MSSPLELVQSDCTARLNADAGFSDVTVTLLRPRGSDGFTQIQSRIDQALTGLVKKAGKSGAAVSVLMPVADAVDLNAPGPLLNVTIMIRVQELVPINMGASGTQKSCEEIALRVLSVLHLFNPGRGCVLVADKDAITPSDAFDPKVTIDVRLTVRSGIAPTAKVARPVINAVAFTVGSSLALTCATAGAAIYYTTDGEYPSSIAPTAQLYSAPFLLAEAATLRFAAEKTDMQQSDVVQQAIS